MKYEFSFDHENRKFQLRPFRKRLRALELLDDLCIICEDLNESDELREYIK